MTDLDTTPGTASPFDYLEDKLREELAAPPLHRETNEAADLDSRYVFPAEPRKDLSPYDCIS